MLMPLCRLFLSENRNVLAEERSGIWFKIRTLAACLLCHAIWKVSGVLFLLARIEDHWNVHCQQKLLTALYFSTIVLRSFVAQNRRTRREHNTTAREGGGGEWEKNEKYFFVWPPPKPLPLLALVPAFAPVFRCILSFTSKNLEAVSTLLLIGLN